MSQFWDAFGGKVAESWLVQLVSPPALYLVVGFGAWVSSSGWGHSGRRLADWFHGLSGPEQGLIAVGGLVAFTTTTAVVSALVPTVLRLLEGYWPPIARPITWMSLRYRKWRTEGPQKRLRELAAFRAQRALSPDEANEFVSLDLKLRRFPPNESEHLPTRLGNTLRAAELRPRNKYGLDTTIVWPHLWLVLPGSTKDEIGDARDRLDQAIAGFIWGTLLVAWEAISWWPAILAVCVCWFFYFRARIAAELYGDLVDAAFDLEHDELYRKMRIPLPASTGSEKAAGDALTQYLWRGQGAIDYTGT